MMTQVDEINGERHFQMQFIEFIEALSRVADRVIGQQANNEITTNVQTLDDTKTEDDISFANDTSVMLPL